MRGSRVLFVFLIILFSISPAGNHHSSVYLPIRTADRQSLHELKLTRIGQFGLTRKARPTVPAHLHTGIDVRRPSANYNDEPVFPVADGIVISKRADGPYGQLIIEHDMGGKKVWSLYEHVAGIAVDVGDTVHAAISIARFFTREELQRFGWQFDHIHIEVLKEKPVRVKYDARHPDRHFGSYSLVCYSPNDLEGHFYNPIAFFEECFADRVESER